MVRPLGADARVRGKHALRRLAERNRNDSLPLGQPLAGAQEKRHARPAPVVDRTLERNERFGLGLRIDPGLLPVAGVLAAHHIARLDQLHAAEDFVLLLADRPRLQGRGRLHRHEREDLKQVGDHHVAKRAGGFVETGASAQAQGLRHIDLHVINEVAIPDRLKQSVGKAEGEDVLRRLFAEEVIDAEDLLFRKYFM